MGCKCLGFEKEHTQGYALMFLRDEGFGWELYETDDDMDTLKEMCGNDYRLVAYPVCIIPLILTSPPKPDGWKEKT